MLEDRDREIKSLLGESDNISAEQKEQLRAVINDVIDFHAMGQASLGRHWNRLSNEQQGEFIDVFSKIVRSQSLADLDVFRSSVAYDVITVTGEEAHVFTTTIYKHVPTSVEYELRYDEGRWLAIDIILDEVSTVKGYSRSFQSIIRKKGFDELMKRLRKKLNETA
ncbi:MAG: ABC transporter substrate-binding protein [Bacteroidetes bacterium]|nr:ABC transporter substrate-binding protein [Bacteroidota bacterium]